MNPELNGWNEIIELAGRDNTPSQGQARVQAIQKEVLAMVNLGNNIFSLQKKIAQRLDTLNERLDQASRSSKSLAKWTIGLTVALVLGTVVQAVAAIIVASK